MSITRLAGVGLRFGWIDFEDEWNRSGVDFNWQWLDALLAGTVLGVVSELPTGAGVVQGQMYLISPGAADAPRRNKLALRVVSLDVQGDPTYDWDYTTPSNGMTVYDNVRKTRLRWNGVEWANAQFASISFYDGAIITATKLIAKATVPVAYDFPANLPKSFCTLETPATANLTIEIRKNDVAFGTITIGAGEHTGSFTAASTTSFASGDRISFVSTNTEDETAAGIGVTLTGVRRDA